MRRHFAAWATLTCLAALTLPAGADDRKPLAPIPTVIVRVKSLDGLIADARYLAELAGKEEEAKQGEALLKQVTGPKGLEGVDTTKPFGMYGRLGPNGIDSDVIVMVPIADDDTALGFIKRFVKAEKGDDGVYTVNIERSPFPVFFRFANGYAYGTIRDKDLIDKSKLLKPADVLAPDKVGTLSATINIDQIPKQAKHMVIGQAELSAAREKENRRPGESEEHQAGRIAGAELAAAYVKQVLTEGGPVDMRLDIDRKKGEIAASASLAGLPETRLADDIDALGKLKSVVSGLVGKDSAINILLHVTVPERFRKALNPIIEQAKEKSLKDEKDESKRKFIELGWKAVMPTLKSAEIDAGISIRGPATSGKFAAVMGLQVKEGGGIDKALREAFSELPKSEQEKAKLDFAKAGGAAIHQINVPGDGDPKMKELLGEAPAYLAVGEKSVLVAAGENGLDSLKEALTTEGSTGTIAQFEMSVNRFARALEKDQPGASAAAKKAFAKDPEADKMRLALTGGKALSLRFSMSAPLVRFFVLMDEAKKKSSDN